MNIYMNDLVAMEIHKERQQELVNRYRLQELLDEHRARRRETMQRLLGLLRPVAILHLVSVKVQRPVVRGV